jgi:hypothetical protein
LMWQWPQLRNSLSQRTTRRRVFRKSRT